MTSEALEEVFAQCDQKLAAETPKAVMVFMSVDYDHQEALNMIAEHWPGVPVVGSSTDGEVSSVHGFKPDSVLLTVLTGDIEVSTGVVRHIVGKEDAATAEARRAIEGRSPSLCFMYCSPMGVNVSKAIRAVESAAEDPFPIVGGLSGDHREFARMVEFHGTEVLTGGAPMLFVFGDLKVSCGIASGWFPIGESHVVTASEGHVVTEIDNKPALDIYREYWGEVPLGGIGDFPLAVYPNGEETHYMRAVLSSKEEDGSLTFAGDIPVGATVRMTEALAEGILAGSRESVDMAVEGLGRDHQADLAFVFSCAARKWVLGRQVEQEIDELMAGLEAARMTATEVIGFYCFGEIAPVRDRETSWLHNETCVTVLVG